MLKFKRILKGNGKKYTQNKLYKLSDVLTVIYVCETCVCQRETNARYNS
jgi:hypothetical protein